MLKEFVNKILDLSLPPLVKVADRQYSTIQLSGVEDPKAQPINCDTLTGFTDYINANVDGVDLKETIIHVKDYKTVLFTSKLDAAWRKREPYIIASCPTMNLNFGNYQSLETFIVMLQSCFLPSETVNALLKIIGNVQDGQVNTFADDGVTQQVTAKVGVSRVENITVPNPVELAPFRTFIELEQPVSKFVFRMKSGAQAGQPPQCALFEADGGKWKSDAVLKVRDWLKEKGIGIPIIA